jgi:hypothetical protein
MSRVPLAVAVALGAPASAADACRSAAARADKMDLPISR